jgi:phosphonate transport system substrate-binding protein
MKKIFKGFATVAVIASAISGQVLAETFTFGIVPQQSATKLAKVWGPVLKHLEAETGVEFQFATATDIPTFEKRLMDGVYDFAYMNPYHFTFFNEHKGYQALAHRADKKIQGLLVTRKDSVITELSQLKGKEVAFPSPAAFAASLVPRGELAKMGINITPRYVSSHDSVYLGVSREFFLAGGGIGRTFNNTRDEVKEELNVLWKTAEYTPHAFANHPRINSEISKKVTAALANMGNSEEGKAALSGLGIQSLKAATDSDWDDVRALNLTLLDSLLN